jgi:hypothetical protein
VKKPKGVPRDEWLLAIGLASHGHAPWADAGSVVIDMMDGRWWASDGSDASAATQGVHDAERIGRDTSDEGNPDAYAAGAALAIALGPQ